MRSISVVFLACASLFSFSIPLFGAETDIVNRVNTFIKVLGSGDRKALAGLVAYPLHREVPLSNINDPGQFLKAFDELLDDALIQSISASSIADDWAEMGWRGTMFQNGALWLDSDGKITAINYQTEKGKRKREALIAADRKNLHASLQKFLEPVLEWKTKDFRIRIDRLIGDTFRYAAWPAESGPGSKPDLVLNNGKVDFDGSGGNHHYDFKSGAYVYRCLVNVIGATDTPPGVLEVRKQRKVVLSQPVVKVITGR